MKLIYMQGRLSTVTQFGSGIITAARFYPGIVVIQSKDIRVISDFSTDVSGMSDKLEGVYIQTQDGSYYLFCNTEEAGTNPDEIISRLIFALSDQDDKELISAVPVQLPRIKGFMRNRYLWDDTGSMELGIAEERRYSEEGAY